MTILDAEQVRFIASLLPTEARERSLIAHDEALRAERDALRDALTAERDALRVSRDATFVQLGHAMRVIRDQISEADAQNAADYEVRLAGLRSLNDLRAAEARVGELEAERDAVLAALTAADDPEVIEKVAQLICSQGPWERVSPYNQQRAREMAVFVAPIVGQVLAALAGVDHGE